jgi:hypothetical protein
MSPTTMVSMGSKAFAEIGVEEGESEEAPGNAQENGVVHTKPWSHGSRIRGVKVPAGGVKNVSKPRGASTRRQRAGVSAQWFA